MIIIIIKISVRQKKIFNFVIRKLFKITWWRFYYISRLIYVCWSEEVKIKQNEAKYNKIKVSKYFYYLFIIDMINYIYD